MLVTVLADASHCPETKVAGYGYWIASARGKFGGGGAMKTFVVTSTVAEMQAIANAVYHGITKGAIHRQDKILLQTDCEAAIFGFRKQRRLSKEEEIVVAWLYNVLDRFELKMELRHVKGHSSIDEPRYAANRVCDKRALRAMRKARNNFRLEQCKEILEGKKRES